MGKPRLTIDICQLCHEKVRGWDYFPNTYRYDTCDLCGDYGLVARVRKDECDLD
jgi:hypothetical protein